MIGLEVLLAVVGSGVTMLVVVAMILITPRGQVEVHAEGNDPEGSNLSPVPASRSRRPRAPAPRAAEGEFAAGDSRPAARP